MLRNALPCRTVTRAELYAVLRYVPSAQVDAGAETVAAGLVDDDGALWATVRGRHCVDRLYAISSGFVADLWSGHEHGSNCSSG